MKRIGILFLFLLIKGNFTQANSKWIHPLGSLPEWSLKIDQTVIQVPVALTPEQRATGLMNQTSLAPNEGMLFVFDFPQRVAFWMKNTPIPLSIAYINSSGTIVEIYDLEPLSEKLVWSLSGSILYALEMPRGWFERHEVKPGTVVRRTLAEGLKKEPRM